MSLTIQPLSFKHQPVVTMLSLVLHEKGGCIGRAEANDLVLPNDMSVSSYHATINYENGAYYLTDHSTNGVYFNDEGAPLSKDTRLLESNTHLTVGDYVLQLVIEAETAWPPLIPRPSGAYEGQFTLRNCLFGFHCLATWQNMIKTQQEGVRLCSECNKEVFYCATDAELVKYVKLNHCIAIPDSDSQPSVFPSAEPDVSAGELDWDIGGIFK